MPILDGIEASIEIRKKFPRIKLIGISMHCDDRILQKLIDIGVHGFIPKMSDSTIFLSVIERVLDGQVVYFNPNETHLKNSENAHSVQDSVDKHKLSARELEILQLIKNCMTSKETAETINLSYYTIETHRKRISKKLNVSSNHGLLKFALEHL